MNYSTQENRIPKGLFSQPLLVVFLAILFAGATFLAGLGVGFGMGRWTGNTDSLAESSLLSPGVFSGLRGDTSHTSQQQLNAEFDVFWESMDILYRDFYDGMPSEKAITYGAIEGVINQLDDPHTSFMTPEDAEVFRSHIDGSFEGIGARVEWDDELDTVRITEPFENQPAWSAGLRRGDWVLAVDGKSIIGTSVGDAVQLIRGEKGTVVVLTVRREEVEEPFEMEITRDRIEIPLIATDTLGEENDIAYIRLSSFSDNSGRQLQQAIQDTIDREASGLIFDLRGNSGGLLREAVKISSLFLDEGDVLIERFNDGREEIYKTDGNAIAADIPMVVLVNEGSASASEIVAGAIQDLERAPLIGTTTFGKGSVQLPHSLSNNGILRVTIARWFTPNDRTIDGEGLTPDIVVEISEEEFENEQDPQLDAAVEHLIELINE